MMREPFWVNIHTTFATFDKPGFFLLGFGIMCAGALLGFLGLVICLVSSR